MTLPLASFQLIRLLVIASLTFLLAFLWAPALLHWLESHKMGKSIRLAEETPVYARLHARKAGTPTMGGLLVWGTVLAVILLCALLGWLLPDSAFARLSFLTRAQTLLPLGALVASALVGLVDDYFNIRRIGAHGGGLRARHRLLIYAAIAAVGAWWFTVKLDWRILHVPFFGTFDIGWWYVPVFMAVLIATAFSVNETDGLDGLAGGVLFPAYAAYALIAFAQGKYDLAVFCAAVIGGLLAFLWFNIHPARFFMGDTGSMSLGITLGVIAMLTNAALLLPVIGFVFVLESLSVLLQLAWRRLFKRKLFLSAPFHHHLEARGWPEPQIVMRLWVVAYVAAALGVALALLDALI